MRIGSFTWWFLIFFVLIFAGLFFWKGTGRESAFQNSSTQIPPPSLTVATEPSPPQPLVVQFVGDIMLDRHIRSNAEQVGYESIIDPELCQYLRAADMVVGNLEGPITTQPSVSQGSVIGSPNNYRFTFDPASVQLLQHCEIRLVNLGNNHMNDFGTAGLQSTYEYLKAADIAYFGDTGGSALDRNPATFIWQSDSGSIGFVNYNQFVPGSWERALIAMRALKPEVDFLVVYTHWGIEYETTMNTTLRNQAKQLVEAGADLIIGTHPHVIGQYEKLDGVDVYYSLGNFVFDQYFSPEVKLGQLVEAEFDFTTKSITTSTKNVSMQMPGFTRFSQ